MPEPVAEDAPKPAASTETGPGTKFGPLRLSDGITKLNATAYYWLALSAIMVFTFIPAAQTALLTTVFGIESGSKGGVAGTATLVAEVVLIITVGIAGAWSDRIGRRPIAVGGYTILGLGIAITPFVGSTIPLYISRGIAAVGMAMITVMITALVADYIRNETRGTANGIVGFCNGIGALITFTLLIKLPDVLESAGLSELSALRTTYLFVAGLAFATALFLQLTLKGGRSQAISESDNEHLPIRRLLRDGLAEAKHPGISFSYAAAFIARADLALVGTFLTLWAQDYGTSVLGLSETEALAKAGILLAVANGVALIAAPVTGIVADRLSRTDAVLISLAIASVGYLCTLLIDNPFSATGYIVATVLGIGQVSAVISSQVLVTEQAPRKNRGSVIGTFALFGGIGIIIAAGPGGLLYDAWRPAAPFVLFGSLGALAFFYGLAVRSKIPNHPPAD